MEENPVTRVFWGRVNVEHGVSLWFYRKGSTSQKVLHALKYKGETGLGIYAGKILAHHLSNTGWIGEIDAIVPVPLHWKKLKKRGYNQAAIFAQGLSRQLSVPVWDDVVERRIATSTQTRKSRYERWENVSEIFVVVRPEKIASRHLLLVDDVITTGATMEACIRALLSVESARVSVASIAFASG
ncbi:MAG: ComF family protein [Bacteroidales bacterium]